MDKVDGKFTRKKGPWNLVWSEVHETRSSAVTRERQIKTKVYQRRRHLLPARLPYSASKKFAHQRSGAGRTSLARPARRRRFDQCLSTPPLQFCRDINRLPWPTLANTCDARGCQTLVVVSEFVNICLYRIAQ
ncbi:MAG: GIY-YIG nuclease family protein [Limisphaerales bacterium]